MRDADVPTAPETTRPVAAWPERAAILVVDDSAEKLLAFEAILEELGEEIVTARSGREALRAVLERDFAVILLDVNMPVIDGFDTASLIRQRPRSEHTPIIFVTAYSDDAQTAKGYSLGAVDYIVTPAAPEVLRSKVSVFVDLFRAARQINQQAAELEKRASQLVKLTHASLAINAALSLDRMLELVCGTARELVDAEAAAAVLDSDSGPRRSCAASALASDQGAFLELGVAASDALAGGREVVRLTAEEISTGESWAAFRPPVPAGPFLSIPLVGRDGRTLGSLHVFGAAGARVTAQDESLLLQLSQIASVAVENTLFYEAREANRLKDEFLTTLSHELRSPLTAILCWTRILRSPRIDATRMLHGLEVIERNVKAQTKLIEDLLDVSRIMTGKLAVNLQPMLLAPTVESTVESLRPSAEAKKLTLRLTTTPRALETGIVMGDSGRLEQVVANLLGNAVKFTPKDGHVDVHLDRRDGEFVLTVRDDGRGISPQFLECVFERFRQADSSTTRTEGGLGIGLAIVRRIVELHGGSVVAESAGLGLGSTFVVRLPVLPVETTHVLETSSRDDSDLSDLQVLVVDDEIDAREVLSEALASSGATVVTAGSIQEALERLNGWTPDVLVSDIAMPNGDGYQLIRHVREVLRAECGSLPALALTAYAREEDRRRAYAAGFQRHLAKPVEPAALISAVSELASRRQRTIPGGA